MGLACFGKRRGFPQGGVRGRVSRGLSVAAGFLGCPLRASWVAVVGRVMSFAMKQGVSWAAFGNEADERFPGHKKGTMEVKTDSSVIRLRVGEARRLASRTGVIMEGYSVGARRGSWKEFIWQYHRPRGKAAPLASDAEETFVDKKEEAVRCIRFHTDMYKMALKSGEANRSLTPMQLRKCEESHVAMAAAASILAGSSGGHWLSDNRKKAVVVAFALSICSEVLPGSAVLVE